MAAPTCSSAPIGTVQQAIASGACRQKFNRKLTPSCDGNALPSMPGNAPSAMPKDAPPPT